MVTWGDRVRHAWGILQVVAALDGGAGEPVTASGLRELALAEFW
mgnify:CR=1 FL=1